MVLETSVSPASRTPRNLGSTCASRREMGLKWKTNRKTSDRWLGILSTPAGTLEPGWVGMSLIISDLSQLHLVHGTRHQLSELHSAFTAFCICGRIWLRRTALLPRDVCHHQKVEIWAASPPSSISLPLGCLNAPVKIHHFSNCHPLVSQLSLLNASLWFKVVTTSLEELYAKKCVRSRKERGWGGGGRERKSKRERKREGGREEDDIH